MSLQNCPVPRSPDFVLQRIPISGFRAQLLQGLAVFSVGVRDCTAAEKGSGFVVCCLRACSYPGVSGSQARGRLVFSGGGQRGQGQVSTYSGVKTWLWWAEWGKRSNSPIPSALRQCWDSLDGQVPCMVAATCTKRAPRLAASISISSFQYTGSWSRQGGRAAVGWLGPRSDWLRREQASGGTRGRTLH